MLSSNARCIINDVPWPIATRVIIPKKKDVLPAKGTLFYKTEKLSPNQYQTIVMTKNTSNYININNLVAGIKFYSNNGECNIKLGIIDNVLQYKKEGTGADLYDRNISYLMSRNTTDTTFIHPTPLQFYIDENGFVDVSTNLDEEFELDNMLYDSPIGLVEPEIGDIVLKIEAISGDMEASITLNYNTC